MEARASLGEGLFCFRNLTCQAGFSIRTVQLGPRVLLFEIAPGKFRLQPYNNRHYLENSRRRSAPLPQTSQGHEA